MTYDLWKLRSDADDLARHHNLSGCSEDVDRTPCCTCGEWIYESDHAHMCGWRSGPNGEHQWCCDACFHQWPETVAGQELEARADRKDGK